ncbi:MAG: hemerythrin domain-containing protein [Roseovarius sp.]|nr:hemerythrin domain-containing protein [Roseovarius sp.]
MSRHTRGRNRGDCLSPTDPALLGNPLDFVYEDHLREREICATLDHLAGADMPDTELAAAALSYLLDELPAHMADEEDGLFPLLRLRCEPDDDIERAIGRLTSDHTGVKDDAPRVAYILAAIESEGRAMTNAEKSVLVRFGSDTRRHLILENAIILPFARLRLTRDDLAALRQGMMRRRGLDRLMENANAD